MYFELIDSTAELLAKSRRQETCCDLPLDMISSKAEALEILTAALEVLGFSRSGYSIVGTSKARQKVSRDREADLFGHSRKCFLRQRIRSSAAARHDRCAMRACLHHASSSFPRCR